MDDSTRTFHPVADLFPMLSGDELAELTEDVRQHGILEPIWLHPDGRIIDGRNRYKACRAAGVEPKFRTWDESGSLVEFVVSLNLHRRHLTASQRAMSALDAEAELAKEAEDRRRQEGRKAALRQHRVSQEQTLPTGVAERVPEKLPEPSQPKGESREAAGRLLGVSGRYVSDAKKLAADRPDLAKKVKSGEMSIPEAKKTIKKEERQAKREMIGAIQAPEPHADSRPRPEPGTWIDLGPHRLYCGSSTDDAFVEACKGAAFAFADPPYNAEAAEWDRGFVWDHDYLTEAAKVVAVTPGISAIHDFMRLTSMTYGWSMAAHISNGMTRGAVGFGNWIYVALFSDQSVYANDQDHRTITVGNHPGPEHKGRKPPPLLGWLIDLYSQPGDLVIDPFAGSGTTLFVAHKLNRRCIAAEIDADFCAAIAATYDKVVSDGAA